MCMSVSVVTFSASTTYAMRRYHILLSQRQISVFKAAFIYDACHITKYDDIVHVFQHQKFPQNSMTSERAACEHPCT